MDQITSNCGIENQLISLLCQSAEIRETVSIPAQIEFWGIDSGIRHAVAGSDYSSVRIGAFMGYRMIADIAGLGVLPLTRAAVARGDEKVDGELLNEWEIDIAQLVAQGHTDAEIGDELYISPISVQRRVVEIAHKLGVRSRIAIALWAWEAGHVRRW